LINFYANYAPKLHQNAGILLNSFTASLFTKLFGHNSSTPILEPQRAADLLAEYDEDNTMEPSITEIHAITNKKDSNV